MDSTAPHATPAAPRHPYADAPAHRRWREAMAGLAGDIDPVVRAPFTLTADTRVVALGSCFAQHIARHLGLRGATHFITEPAHPILDAATAAAWGYGVYTARMGNIYTARQLLQLFDRAHGTFRPVEDCWRQDGRWVDPFRPAIEPGGFASALEFEVDRARHFAALRRAFAELDVLIFTLGLTEAWESTQDGAVFPVCPGTIAGRFDPATHRLHDFDVTETIDDLGRFLDRLRAINPGARVILTVSPVPLVATARDEHVLPATMHAKSVLRVACEALARRPNTAYFPSYEIIAGPHGRDYFASDRRSVTEAGVEHVMRVFFRHYAPGLAAPGPDHAPRPAPLADDADLVAVLCEEESLGSVQPPHLPEQAQA